MKLNFSNIFADVPMLRHQSHTQKEYSEARKPWAVAASMGVLILGSLFLLISATIPIRHIPLPQTPAASSSSPLSLQSEEAILAVTSRQKTVQIAPKNRSGIENDKLVSQIVNQDEHKPQGLVPRLKPATIKTAKITTTQAKTTLVQVIKASINDETNLKPRLKPQRTASKTTSYADHNISANPLFTNPLNLHPIALTSSVDNPPPFFTEQDTLTNTALLGNTYAFSQIPEGDLNASTTSHTAYLLKGESFVDLLKRSGIRRTDRNGVTSELGKHIKLRRLQAGLKMELTTSPPNQTWFQASISDDNPSDYLLALKIRTDDEKILKLKRQRDGTYTAVLTPIQMTKRLQTASGSIDGNLYVSMRKQGAPDEVIHNLANIFAFDVDFQRDIFRGDGFETIYEVWYDEDGNVARGGEILFAKLDWRGRSKNKGYYLYSPQTKTMQPDYFDAKGQSARRLLMKTPIDGARLSSRFGPRKHPILGYRKTHKGVDFAARRGTPIKATGDGVIERSNRYGSFGNYIRIRHANGYKTAYAHLKGFSRGIKKGKRVRQGDIIGYVGTTGRSTGPHLHYEVHHKGHAVNPQKLKIATGIKLNGKALNNFKARRDIINRLRKPVEPTNPAAPGDGTSRAVTGK